MIDILLKYSNQIGLFASFLGTVFVAIAIGKGKDGYAPYSTNPKTGESAYIAYVNKPKLFKWGMFFIGLGFIIQLFSSFLLK